jgi:hypothetical protein
MTSTQRRQRPPARRWLAAAAPVLAACVAVTTLAACGSSPAPARTQARTRPSAAAPRVSTADAFLTVSTLPLVTRRFRRPFTAYIVRYPVSTVQLRALRGGGVVTTLLSSLGNVDAVLAPGGSVIAVASFGCRSDVYRIDPRAGRTTLIRTLPGSAWDIALSPDGRRLAYLTYPANDRQPCQPERQPPHPVRELVNPGGPIQFLPSVLAVVSLATGATVRARTPDPGNPPGDPAWSPDGLHIAVTYSGSDNPILVVPASHPSFATARRIRPPRHCGYVTATWTVAGLTAVLGCGRQGPDLSPRTLVRLSSAGRATARWQLPACIDGVHVVTDPAARQVLVEADTGYGNGPPCGRPGHPGRWLIRIERIRGAALAGVASYPQNAGQLELTGW